MRTVLHLLLVTTVFTATPFAAGQNNGLRAGAAKVDITPTQPCLLSGYASRTNLSIGAHDPLCARALALEHNGRRLVLVSVDVIAFHRTVMDYIRRPILDVCGLKPEELVISGTHTHAAPKLSLDAASTHPNNVEHTKTLGSKLQKVVQDALAAVRPARIGVGIGASPVGVNRREPFLNKKGQRQIRLGRNPDGSTDKDVQVLQVPDRETERLLAVLFAYATHSTSLGAKNLFVSGDVHGLAAQFIEKHLGTGIIAPGFAGASGNIDPWFRVMPEIKTDNGWIPEPVLLGTMLGEEVVHTSNKILEFSQDGPIQSLIKTIELPVKANPTSTVPVVLTAARVGNVAFVGIGAEVFHEIGQAIKKASPFPHTFVITHCNGGALGYLVVKEAYAEGGYEVSACPFAPEAADIAIKEIANLLNQLHTN
jgi:hypothetical protein